MKRFWCWMLGGHVYRLGESNIFWHCKRCGHRSYI